MANDNEQLRKRIAAKSHAELREILDAPEGTYKAETIQFAQEELDMRPLPEELPPPEPPHVELDDTLPAITQRETDSLEAPAKAFVADTSRDMRERLPRSNRVLTLKDECIRDGWAEMVYQGAEQGDTVLNAIHDRLLEAEIPGNCLWTLQEVQSSGLLSRVRREFLIVTWDEFRDYRQYICVRDFGIHLHCSWMVTVEPGMLKKWLSEKLTDHGDALSAPKNILVHQDLVAWTSIVRSAVILSVHELMKELEQEIPPVQFGSKDFMKIW